MTEEKLRDRELRRQEWKELNWRQKTKRNVWDDFKKLWPILLFSLLMLYDSSNRSVVLFAMAVTTGVVAVAHLTRRFLFPYIHMSELIDAADNDPLASSIVFAAMIALVISLIMATVMLLR